MCALTNTVLLCSHLPQYVGLRRGLHENATVGADLPLIARRAELAILTGAIEAAKCGRGGRAAHRRGGGEEDPPAG